MFGKKKTMPVQDVKKHLPELQAYVRERYKPKSTLSCRHEAV